MKTRIFLGALIAALMGGCTATAPSSTPTEMSSHTSVVVTAPEDYSRLVGRRVELVGVVSQTRIPQLHGIDIPQLEAHRGRKVKATEILRQSVVTQAEIEARERQAGGAVPHRGPGTYYYLEDLRYEPQP